MTVDDFTRTREILANSDGPFDPLADLKPLRRWVLWRRVETPSGKTTKPPFQANGQRASVTNPEHWVTYDEASEAYIEGDFDGVGLVLTPGGGVGAVDLDLYKISDKDELAEVEGLIARLDSYTELSPSGKGAHIIVRIDEAGLPGPGVHTQGVEIYDRGRYMTVTETPYPGTPIKPVRYTNGTLTEIYHHYAGSRTTTAVDDEAPAVDDEAVRPLAEIPLAECDRVALVEGSGVTDRSNEIPRIAQALFACGASPAEVLYYLSDEANFLAHAALDRRGHDTESARQWLWRYTVGPMARRHESLLVDLGDWTEVAKTEGWDKPIKKPRRLHFRRVSDIEVKPPEWLIDGYVEARTVSLWFGDPQAYKTFTLLDQMLCIATGKPWHGHAVQQGATLYVCGEGQQGISRRVEGWCRHHGIDRGGVELYVSDRACNFLDAEAVRDFKAAIKQDVLDMLAAGVEVKSICIDTLARNLGGDENSNTDINALFTVVDELMPELNCAVQIACHPGHGNPDRPRGGSALLGNADAYTKVERIGEPDDRRTTLRPIKMKDAPCGAPLQLIAEVVTWPECPEGTLVLRQATDEELFDEVVEKAEKAGKKRAFIEAGEEAGRHNRLELLHSVREHPERRERERAEDLGKSRQAIGRKLKQLIDEGYLIEKPAPGSGVGVEGPTHRYELTEKGAAELEARDEMEGFDE